MPRRLANLVLLAAVASLLATGIVAWLLPESAATWLYVAHRVAGITLVLALVWKYTIARRSLRRRGLVGASVWLGLATALATVLTAGLGLAWTAGLVSFDSLRGGVNYLGPPLSRWRWSASMRCSLTFLP